MSFVIDQFQNANKWTEIRIGTSVVSDRKTTSFKATVSNADDKAGLVTFDPYDLSSCDIRALADRGTARTILLIRTVKDVADPMPDEKEWLYAFIRDRAYGVQVYNGAGFPYLGSDPVNPSEMAELRITISAGVISFYYAGVLVYSEPSRIPATSLYVYLMSYATSYGATIAGTTVFGATGFVPLTANITPSEPQTIFIGDSVIFNALASGGTPPYTIQWYVNDALATTDTTFTFTPMATGAYSVYAIVNDSIGGTAKSNSVLVTVVAMILKHTLTVDSTPIQGIPFTIERMS